MPKIAVAQYPSVLLNRNATVARAVELADEAAGQGAVLVVFPEAFVPGYPTWVWRLRPGVDSELSSELYRRLVDQAVDLGRDHLQPLQEVARRCGITIMIGIDERASDDSRSTLYNTYVMIGPDGQILNRHRKLMPTNPERMVWGFGDGSGMRVLESEAGRVGALLCWENYMPLARYAMYSQGIEVYVAPTWDCGDGWVGTMQHIAREGRCWVVSSGTALHATEIPDDLPGRDRLFPDGDEWINSGDSFVVKPGGAPATEPLHRANGIVYAEVDPEAVAAARRSLDVAGHYARPDVLQLWINREPQSPLVDDAPRKEKG